MNDDDLPEEFRQFRTFTVSRPTTADLGISQSGRKPVAIYVGSQFEMTFGPDAKKVSVVADTGRPLEPTEITLAIVRHDGANHRLTVAVDEIELRFRGSLKKWEGV